MSATTETRYIRRDPQILSGEPTIVGTRTPVRAIVELWRLGVAPEEIPSHLPHRAFVQVFNALGYCSDHQAEIGAFIERNAVPETLSGTRRPRLSCHPLPPSAD